MLFIKCGIKRANYKRTIQRYMDMADINQRKLANIAGVTKTAVSRTLNGLQHSPAVLDALRSIGVPEKYLFDPRKVEAAA